MPFGKWLQDGFFRVLSVLLTLWLLSAACPAFALWLPWATEESKVTKAVVDVWQALINNDQRFLADHVAGTGAKTFVDQELAVVKSLGIKKYNCQVKKVTLLPPNNSWAIVEFDKVATLGNGEGFTNKAFSVLGKTDGEWKVMVGVGDKLKVGQEMLNIIRQGAGAPGPAK